MRWLLVGLVTIALGVGVVVYMRASLVRVAVMAMLERAGIPVRTLDVGSVKPDGLVLDSIAIGGLTGPNARNVRIFWTAETLAARRVVRVEIGELEVSLTYAEGVLNVNGLALPTGGPDNAAAFDRLDIASVKILATTPWGQAAATGNAGIVSGTGGMTPARIGLATATFELAGGRLSLSDIVFELNKPVDGTLMAERVDLQALFNLIDVEGLSGSGSISGALPIRLDGAGVRISDGKLAATEPGILRYLGDALPHDVPGADDKASDAIDLTRVALADFYYSALLLGLERAASGDGSLTARIEGSNPNVLDNHPFIVNIRLDANFDTLAEILLDGYAMAEQLLRGRLAR